tara:strand:- start:3472 stop:3915 length:444 start_codon:yes stop_codon:yes gene_type:complete
MFNNGKLDVRCGTYSFEIVPPPPPEPPKLEPPKLSDLNCHANNEFGDRHPDVHRDSQRSFAKEFCQNDKVFDSGSKPDLLVKANVLDSPSLAQPYRFEVSWIDGCQTTESSQKKGEPITGTPKVTCFSLMEENFKNCKWKSCVCLVT